MKSQVEQWAMVRVRKSTLAQLRQCQQLFTRLAEERKLDGLSYTDRFGLSLDSVVRVLLFRDNDHRRRSSKAGRSKAKVHPAEEDSPEDA